MTAYQNIDSDELLKLLFMESSLDHIMDGENAYQQLPAFSDYITAMCARRGEAPERVIRRADIDKSYGHQVFRGIRNPSRDTVLKLAFGFEADYELAQSLLKIARQTPLHPRVKRDMVLIFCLQHHYTVVEAQIALNEYQLPLLGGGCRNE